MSQRKTFTFILYALPLTSSLSVYPLERNSNDIDLYSAGLAEHQSAYDRTMVETSQEGQAEFLSVKAPLMTV